VKLSLETAIEMRPEIVWAEVQTASLLIHIAWPMVRFLPVNNQSLDSFRSGGRYQVKLRLFGFLPFGTQWIVTSVHEPETGVWPKRLRDNGYSAMIDKWDHWITIAPGASRGTVYRDDVEIAAGIFTPFIWAFAQVFYRHRQRRWRGLAHTLHTRHLISNEMAAYCAARSADDTTEAWSALERAHILSQPYVGLHLANHWAMLTFAASQHDAKEVFGQILRLALAPLGALSGRIPVGNIGRATVSAFKPMPIPEDLLEAMTKPD
jgi:hypothetical protein